MMRIFVDMDGVLAKWGYVEYEEQLYEKGYFRNLEPVQNVLDNINKLIKQGYNVYILSKYLENSRYALKEKREWIEEFLPTLSKDKQIWVKYSENKSDCIPKGIQKDDFLIDDYSPNLFEFARNGGQGIKLLNGINHTKGTWKGENVQYDDQELSNNIMAIIKKNLIHVMKFNIFGRFFISYDMTFIDNDKRYMGFVEAEDTNGLDENQLKEIVMKDEIYNRKKDLMELSIATRYFIGKMIYSSNTDQHGYKIVDKDIISLAELLSDKYKIIDKDVIIKCFNKDMNLLIENKYMTRKDNDYYLSADILIKYDFTEEKVMKEKSQQYESRYYLSQDFDELEIACEYKMPIEYMEQKEKERERVMEL